MILPSDGAARIPRESAEGQPHQPRELTLDPVASPRSVHEAQRLVKPNGDPWSLAKDQRTTDPRLRLREGTRPRVLKVPWDTDRPPPVGKVPVEIDPVGVLARAGRDAVGVQLPDDPEEGLLGRRVVGQVPDHRQTPGLIAVNDADG